MSIVRFLRIGVAVMTAMILGGSKSHCQETRKGNEMFHGYFFSWYCCVVNEFGSRCDAKSEIEPNLYTQHIARVISDFRPSPNKYQVVLPVTSHTQFLICHSKSTLKSKTIGDSNYFSNSILGLFLESFY